MPSSPIPFLQRNLDTTLQLVIALSAAMTAEELVSFRVRLTEASIILGTVLATQEGVVPNGKSIPTLQSSLTHSVLNSRRPRALLARTHPTHGDSSKYCRCQQYFWEPRLASLRFHEQKHRRFS